MSMVSRPAEPKEDEYATADVCAVMQQQVQWVRKTSVTWIKKTQQADSFTSSLESLPPLEIQEAKASKDGPPKKKCKTATSRSYKDSYLQSSC